jgi:Tfp pilus assembly protein PilO
LKDIQNNSVSSVAAALEKLDRAVLRLERATETLVPQLPRLADVTTLEQSVASSQKENAILREAVGRVSSRLDQVIGRLQNTLKD